MRLLVEKITDIRSAYTLQLAADELNRQLASESKQIVAGPFASDVQVDFQLSRIDRRLLLDVHLRAELALECGRCLVPFASSLDEAFTLALSLDTSKEAESREELELEDEQVNSIQVNDGEIELEPLLLEQTLFRMPAYPCCKDDCAGLCPHCGLDLNSGRCDCEPLPFNNRFGKLKNLKLD